METKSSTQLILDKLTWPWRLLQDLDTRSALRPGADESQPVDWSRLFSRAPRDGSDR